MNISILTDDPKSWFVPYGEVLRKNLEELGHNVDYIFTKDDLRTSDITFLLSCSHIFDADLLSYSDKNVVIHASELPRGKGFSPLQWQILEGNNDIVLSAIEATDAVDAGPIYLRKSLKFNGTELYEELREKLAECIIEMACYLVLNNGLLVLQEQKGEESFYRRRTIVDDELNPQKSIADQFNHFRIADNKNHPLYFYFKGEKYFLRIDKE